MAAAVAVATCLFLAAVAVTLADGDQQGLGLSDLVPDVLSQEPGSVLEVRYGAGDPLTPGQEFKPAQVRSPPTVTWSASDPGDLFTVCMTDPDAPSRANQTWGQFLHWMVANAPAGAPEAGDTIAEYVGAGPPSGTGLHRYALLVFKQTGRLELSDEPRRNASSRAARPRFNIQRWAEAHSLELPASAGNYFVAQWDESVPELHKQLSG